MKTDKQSLTELYNELKGFTKSGKYLHSPDISLLESEMIIQKYDLNPAIALSFWFSSIKHCFYYKRIHEYERYCKNLGVSPNGHKG